MSDPRAEQEARYPGLPSRWLAYCYAVGGSRKAGPRGARQGSRAQAIGSPRTSHA